MKFIPGIKRRWLRRCVMVTVLPWATSVYLYNGLRSMVAQFRYCWNYQYEEA